MSRTESANRITTEKTRTPAYLEVVLRVRRLAFCAGSHMAGFLLNCVVTGLVEFIPSQTSSDMFQENLICVADEILLKRSGFAAFQYRRERLSNHLSDRLARDSQSPGTVASTESTGCRSSTLRAVTVELRPPSMLWVVIRLGRRICQSKHELPMRVAGTFSTADITIPCSTS